MLVLLSNTLDLPLVLLQYSFHQQRLVTNIQLDSFYGKIICALQVLEVLDISLPEPSASTPWATHKLIETTGWHTATSRPSTDGKEETFLQRDQSLID